MLGKLQKYAEALGLLAVLVMGLLATRYVTHDALDDMLRDRDKKWSQSICGISNVTAATYRVVAEQRGIPVQDIELTLKQIQRGNDCQP